MLFKEVTEDFSFVVGKRVYTMGPGGDFDTARPMEILNMTYKSTSSTPSLELPIDIIPQAQYKYEELKELTSNIPTEAYVNYEELVVSISFWAVPAVGKLVSISSTKALTTYTSLSTTINLPPGWLEAIEYNLALRVRPSYGVGLDPSIQDIARKSKTNIKRQNKKPYKLQSEVALLHKKSGLFDYRTGE